MIYNSSTGDNMEKYNVRFKKRYGQNFLKSSSIVKRIVSVSGVDKDSLVIEVGPGGAIMTRELALKAGAVLAYEIDSDLAPELDNKLADFDNVDIVYQDFLLADIASDVSNYSYKKIFFVSNVPYYITTPIILKLLSSGISFENIVMMVQKEVGDRFTSTCGTKDYGSIAVYLQYYYCIKKEFFVSRKEFVPEPKVDSVIISFLENKNRLVLKSEQFFEIVVRDSFQYRRKTIRNNLKKYDLDIVRKVLSEYNFDLNVRAEMLPVDCFVKLANALWK